MSPKSSSASFISCYLLYHHWETKCNNTFSCQEIPKHNSYNTRCYTEFIQHSQDAPHGSIRPQYSLSSNNRSLFSLLLALCTPVKEFWSEVMGELPHLVIHCHSTKCANVF